LSKSFFIETYGCQMNVYDSELIVSILTSAGFSEVINASEADIILANTCAIREHATERVFNKLSNYLGYKKSGSLKIMGVLGCMPQHDSEQIKQNLPFIDFVAGPDNYQALPEIIHQIMLKRNFIVKTEFNNNENYEQILPARQQGTMAYVTIMRGCNNFCAYCVVPYTRGRERSKDAESVIKEIEATISEGFTEITLLGQNVNSYNSKNLDFPQLLEKIAAIPGLKRLRFFTSHPKDISDELIEVMARNPVICKSLHLPFQAGSNSVLERMNRGYTIEKYLTSIQKVKTAMPDISLTTDVIVGFPGESEADFLESLAVIEKVGFDNSFTFIYSQRNGTKAAEHFPDDVSDEIKGDRLNRLKEFQKSIGLLQLRKDVGKTRTVLIESVSKKRADEWKGRTEQNRIVIFKTDKNCQPGDYLDIKINRADGVTLFGEVVDN